MTERDWDMLTAHELGDILADIKEWMLPPYSVEDMRRSDTENEKLNKHKKMKGSIR